MDIDVMRKKHMLTTKDNKDNTLYLVYRSDDRDIDGWPTEDDTLLFITKDASEALIYANNEWDRLPKGYDEDPDRYELMPNDMTNYIREVGIGMDYELAWQLGVKDRLFDWAYYISVIKVILDQPTNEVKKEENDAN